jgi:hypothetical protein
MDRSQSKSSLDTPNSTGTIHPVVLSSSHSLPDTAAPNKWSTCTATYIMRLLCLLNSLRYENRTQNLRITLLSSFVFASYKFLFCFGKFLPYV